MKNPTRQQTPRPRWTDPPPPGPVYFFLFFTWLIFSLLAGSASAGADDGASDSLYAALHPRLMFTTEELPALYDKVRDGGWDDWAYTYARGLYPSTFEEIMSGDLAFYDFGIGEFPTLGVIAFLERPPDTTWIDLGKLLAQYLVDDFDPDDNVFYSPLRLRSLCLGYDMFYGEATESERAAIRGEIEAYVDTMLTTRAYVYWKYRPFLSNITVMIASSLGLAAICLDGETDPGRVDAALAMADDYIETWLEYQMDPDGSYKEGSMYAGWCMKHLCYYFWARVRYDGYDYAADPRVRNMEKWVAYELLPFGDAQINNTNDAASLNHPFSRHHTYFGWAQTAWNSGLAAWLWERLCGPVYGFDSGHLSDPASTVLWARDDVAPVHPSQALPRSFLWEDRGLYYFRTGWQTEASSDDVVFSFYSGKFHGGHAHEDQNNFTLYGFGTRFAIDHGFLTPNQHSNAHNMIFVDGRGQHHAGGTAGTDGKIAEYLMGDFADYLLGDATSAYNTYSEFDRNGYPFPENDWSAGHFGSNPVRYAYRRFVVVHDTNGPPYFILMDDIDKDGSTHSYEWRMHTDEANAVDVSNNPVVIEGERGRMDLRVVSPEFSRLNTALQAFDNGHEDPDATIISLSLDAVDPGFVFLMTPGDDESPRPVFDRESLPWGEAFTLRWPDDVTDFFLRNRAETQVTYAPDSAAGLPSMTTDARFALVRFEKAEVTKHLASHVTSLDIGGVKYVDVNDGSANVSLAGSVVEMDRESGDFSFYAPGADRVTFRGQTLTAYKKDGYLVAGRPDVLKTPGAATIQAVRAYPNPFNAAAKIDVLVNEKTVLSVDVHDAGGRLVRRLWNGRVSPGRITLEWDGRDRSGEEASSGVYLVTAASSKDAKTTKLVHVK